MNLLNIHLLKKDKVRELKSIDTINHYPVSTREWNNNIYVYNKNTINFIPVALLTATKLIKSYFSLFNPFVEKVFRARKLRIKYRKRSKNKIFLSNNEFKHNNNKVLINLYLFNREEKVFLINIKKIYNNWKKRISNRKNLNLKYKLNNLKNKFDLNFFLKRRYYHLKINNISKLVFYNKKLHNLKKKRKKFNWDIYKIYFYTRIHYLFYQLHLLKKEHELKKYLITNYISINIKDKYLLNKILNISDLYFFKLKTEIKKNIIEKLELFFSYKQLILINKLKFNYVYLQYLKKYLQQIFNKDIEFNIINLKRFYLNSDILLESIKLKISNNRRSIFRYLSKFKNKIKIKDKNEFLNSEFLTAKKIYDPNIEINKISLKKKIIKNIRYKNIIGFRLEAKGRLTKRHTASRSVKKLKYKGSLLDLYSSYKGLSSVLLKGNLESNLQFTKMKSKTNIGSFGLKGWISGY